VERVNSRLDVSFGFEHHLIRGLKKMKLLCRPVCDAGHGPGQGQGKTSGQTPKPCEGCGLINAHKHQTQALQAMVCFSAALNARFLSLEESEQCDRLSNMLDGVV
jgi:hypothetical protein